MHFCKNFLLLKIVRAAHKRMFLERSIKMDYKQTYEILLKSQCDAYEQMLYAITQISECDDLLLSSSNKETIDADTIQNITEKKEYFIQLLDKLSVETEQEKHRIADILYLYNDFHFHPLYQRMEQLQTMAREELEQIIKKEDTNNPTIVTKLTQYKEKLEMDIKIREIPMKKRKIFFIHPDK